MRSTFRLLTNLFNAVIKSKLDYFGHIARRDSDSLEKQIMFGKVEGSRTRGRPKLRWTDGITLATGKLHHLSGSPNVEKFGHCINVTV